MDAELFENLRLELRRGCLIVAVLAQLRVEHYGYTLRKALAEYGLSHRRRHTLPTAPPARDPGLLASEWREQDKRNKRFYRLSADGETILQQLLAEWQTINSSLARILETGISTVGSL